MQKSEKMSEHEITGFLEHWKKHPLAIPIIIVLVTSSFLLIVVQGLENYYKLQIAYLFTIFCFFIFYIVIRVLIKHKIVFYNITELILLEVERNLRDIQDSLADLEIGFGVAFDEIRAPPISNELADKIKRFEVLTSILKNIDYKPDINDKTKKALAKYYFRKGNYPKGLFWADEISTKNDPEYNFIKGLLLWKTHSTEKSREFLGKSNFPKANYYKFITYVTEGKLTKENINKYITEVTKETSPLYADFYAQLHLSHAYRQLAIHFPSHGNVIDLELLQKALTHLNDLIKTTHDPFAYYNAACYICILGEIRENLDQQTAFNEQKYKEMILDYLEKAISKNIIFLSSLLTDKDLEWIRKMDTENYYKMIGRHYERKSLTQ